jgi:hypothetical protein
MTSFLLLGMLLGLRHALEADHLAAVATFATRQRGVTRSVLQGAAWGAGHGFVLLAVGGSCVLLGVRVPERAATVLEAGVGAMLLWLGWGVLRRARLEGLHLRPHEHADGTSHLHLLLHGQGGTPGSQDDRHGHRHGQGVPWRAVGVGMVHGLAGSAALVLLVAASLASPFEGLLYIACFGVGGVCGMAALSAAIAWPLARTGKLAGGARRTLERVVGVTALGVGLWVLYSALGLSD